jgi:hypothetical protein
MLNLEGSDGSVILGSANRFYFGKVKVKIRGKNHRGNEHLRFLLSSHIALARQLSTV